MLGIAFYLIFSSLFFLTIYYCLKKPINVIYTLLISSQFNVTSFFKAGITVSFFEINLFICLFLFTFKTLLQSKNLKARPNIIDKIFILFSSICFISIGIAALRVGVGDLVPDSKIPMNFALRSLMSLNKLFVFIPILIFLRSYLERRYPVKVIQDVFLRALVYSGVLPMLAAVIQFSAIGFYLIHNNPSFAEEFHVENYVGQRIVGLTNEASFYVYQLFFSTLGVYYCYQKRLISRVKLTLLALLFSATVIFSISRTGLLIYILLAGLISFRAFKKNLIQFFVKFTFGAPLLILLILFLSALNVGGFNLMERLMSTFQVDSDASTLERYGSMEALFYLIYDKCLWVGTGIYNYQYYVKSYLPYYMDAATYGAGDAPPSYNFILQLIAEFGIPLAIVFLTGTYMYLNRLRRDRIVVDWFLFLFLFSLSFQTLNFSIPFLILLYPLQVSNEDPLRSR